MRKWLCRRTAAASAAAAAAAAAAGTAFDPYHYCADGWFACCEANLALQEAEALANASGGSFEVTHDRRSAFEDADVVYAKSWGAVSGLTASAGGHADAVSALSNWTVTEADLRLGKPARFLHCLPVRRNVVVAGQVLDGELSSVLDQAANRVWGQAALLLALLGR